MSLLLLFNQRVSFPQLIESFVPRASAGVWLRLGEASGTFEDSIGNNDGTEVGALTRHVADSLIAADDGGISTSSVLNYVTIPDTPDVDGEVWTAIIIAAANSVAAAIMVSKGTGSWNLGRRTDTGKFILGKPGTAILFETAAAIPTNGTKKLYIVTRNGTGIGNTHIYVNGVEDTVAVAPTQALVDNGNALHIGHDQDPGNGAPWNGLEDEFVFLKGLILTAAEAKAVFDSLAVSGAMRQGPTPAAQAFALGMPAPGVVDSGILIPVAALGLVMPAPSLLPSSVPLGVQALGLAMPAPVMGETLILPAALPLGLVMPVPGMGETAIAPPALPLGLTAPAPVLVPSINPAALPLGLAAPAPTLVELAGVILPGAQPLGLGAPVPQLAEAPVATPIAGGGGGGTLPRGPWRPGRKKDPAPVVANALMDNLVAEYGINHGREVYFAMEREHKGPFAPGNKYDATLRRMPDVHVGMPVKRVPVRANPIPPARRS